MSLRDRLATRRARQRENRLVYAHVRCCCGALFAYDPKRPWPTAWDCSDVLLQHAIPAGQPGAVKHDDVMPFIFWKVNQAPQEWALANRVQRPGPLGPGALVRVAR